MNVCTLFFGILLDKYGTFVCRSCATLTITIGLIFLFFTPTIHWFLFVGMILYTAPTFSLLVSNQPIAFLFPRFAAFIMVFGQWRVSFSIPSRWFLRSKFLNPSKECPSGIASFDLLFLVSILWRTPYSLKSSTKIVQKKRAFGAQKGHSRISVITHWFQIIF